MRTAPVDLTTSLQREGDGFALEVVITNRLDQPIYVVDKLVVSRPGKKFARTDAVTVMNADTPGVVKIALAAVSADEPSTVLYPPTFRRVAPGETSRRVIAIPAPLKAWHPVAGVMPIAATAKTAVFQIQYFVGEPASWHTVPSDDPQPIQVPEGHALQLLQSQPMPLP